jgi:HlyD family secretion protein
MNIQNLPDRREIESLLGLGAKQAARRWTRRLAWLVALAALVGLGLWWYTASQTAATQVTYDTEPARMGNLTVTVTATGTVQPTTQVEVSSEMSGIVRAVNVDNNNLIKKGDVLASLDTERFAAQLASMAASVTGAKAKLADAQATLKAAEATLKRQSNLQRRGVTTAQDLETAEATQQRARAATETAQAEIDIANANLKLKQLDITKSQILSPIDGIVLKRTVEPGQTVASSLQAPVLFTLAEDLTRMQLEANVDEADIGSVAVDQSATFTVDAFPGRGFPAKIASIDFSPITTDGVVTYKATLSVDNADLALRPGMTATTQIVVKQVANAVLAPNAALRYQPPAAAKQESFSLTRFFMPRFPRGERQPRRDLTSGQRTVYVLENNVPKAMTITTGATDGKMIEIVKGEIKADQPLITASRKGPVTP